jgi:hypothetical protein
MSKTAVGLFEHSDLAHQVVHDLETGAFPQGEIRILGESRDMSVDGVMSTPRTDFEVSLNRELQAIGANGQEAIAYVKGVRRGGLLVFATGSIEQVDNAAEIMNRHGAIDVEKLVGNEPDVASMAGENMTPVHESSNQTGRISQPGGGARMFVW